MLVKEFITNVLIKEIKEIQQDCGYHYLSFGLISQGIEFLGACIDDFEFEERNKSKERFNNAIKELFPEKYHDYIFKQKEQFDLYSNLRCGILHVVVPGSFIELIQESEIEKFGTHLEHRTIRGNERLILVSQILMSDFENACNQIISQIENREISNPKVYKNLISTSL